MVYKSQQTLENYLETAAATMYWYCGKTLGVPPESGKGLWDVGRVPFLPEPPPPAVHWGQRLHLQPRGPRLEVRVCEEQSEISVPRSVYFHR